MRNIIIIIFCFGIKYSYAQLSIEFITNNTGGAANPAAIHMDWSVGEMTSIDFYSGANTIITAGVLQDFLSVPTAINYPVLSPVQIQLYPNPVTEGFLCTFNFSKQGNISIRLTNTAGQMISNWQIPLMDAGVFRQYFDMTGFTRGTYFAEIIYLPTNGRPMKEVYSIIKL